MNKRNWIISAILVAALALTIGAGSAFARGGNFTQINDGTWDMDEYCDGSGFMGGGYMGMGGIALDEATDVLGLTAEELDVRLEAGATIADIAAEEGVDLSLVIDAILAAHTEIVQARVDDGVITEADAQIMLEQMR